MFSFNESKTVKGRTLMEMDVRIVLKTENFLAS